MEFEPVIGLETHIQLNTNSKIFCGSSAAFGGAPNEYIDPVTLGLPGALPVLNRRVVECAIMLGLALKCEIRKFSRFARKHYFYPDLPKGYQISQYDEPLCERGTIEVLLGEATRTIGITRIHLEEDAGKNIHDAKTNASLVDLNRAGVGLLEIVTEPDLRSPAEAAAYMRTLRQMVRYLGISDGNMEEGSLRCDANISLRPVGSVTFGTRTEVKNINSFRFVERALEYEIARQSGLLRSGKKITQETLLFDSATETTRPMRSKEESSDYRYFPDPDLPPLEVEESWIREVEARQPKLPQERLKTFVETYGLSRYDASVLTTEPQQADYFEAVFEGCGNAKAACNWVTSELYGALNRTGTQIGQSPVAAAELGALIKLIDTDVISGKMAKVVFEEMLKSGKPARVIVEEKGLKQVTDEGAIATVVAQVFDNNQKQAVEFIGGNERLISYFVGQVMKATGGSANPKMVNELIKAEAQKRKK